MALFDSLYTSAAGMEAQQKATSTISTNIANINTTGFKRSDITFKELVASSANGGTGASNSVFTVKTLRASQAGAIKQTSSTTDAAISGNGFFAVKTGTGSELETFYTRAGNFSPDSNGILRNAAGYVLHGWSLSQDGVANTSSLVPVDVDILQTQSLPTTAATLSLNLDSGETDYDPHLFSPSSQLPANSQNAHFTRSLTVYDQSGTARTVSMEFRKVIGPMAHFTSVAGPISQNDVLVDNSTGPTPNITAGDTFEITDGTETLTIDFVNGTADASLNEANTMKDVLNLINNFTGTDTTKLFEARLTSQGRLLVQAKDPTVTLDITNSVGNTLGAGGFNFITDPVDGDYAYAPDFDITADPENSIYPTQGDLPAIANTTNPNTQNWWELTITIPDPADPSGTATTAIRQGLLNFDSSGALNATADANGDLMIDLASEPIDFDSADATEDTGFTIDVTRFTQFAGNYDVLDSDQNGAGTGNFAGVTISRDGIVSAQFTNGQEVPFYQIPLATFTNTNGLQELSGTAFRLGPNSGDVTYSAPDTNGAGFLVGSSIENSNVDLSGEFGNLIVTQRAFSLNGQVLNAVDEMTRNLSQLA